eukprot:1147111-Pelagomonas_calceolata.AAC.3
MGRLEGRVDKSNPPGPSLSSCNPLASGSLQHSPSQQGRAHVKPAGAREGSAGSLLCGWEWSSRVPNWQQ